MTTVEILKEMAFTATETQRRALEDAISALSTEGDLISRQAVIDVVKKWFDKIQLNGDICLDGIVSLPSVENKGKWIPVSERLPDNNVRVLCCAISTSISGGYTRFVGCCDNGDWFVQTDAETVSYPRQYEVTAWMPLPEPYKPEKDGENDKISN